MMLTSCYCSFFSRLLPTLIYFSLIVYLYICIPSYSFINIGGKCPTPGGKVWGNVLGSAREELSGGNVLQASFVCNYCNIVCICHWQSKLTDANFPYSIAKALLYYLLIKKLFAVARDHLPFYYRLRSLTFCTLFIAMLMAYVLLRGFVYKSYIPAHIQTPVT